MPLPAMGFRCTVSELNKSKASDSFLLLIFLKCPSTQGTSFSPPSSCAVSAIENLNIPLPFPLSVTVALCPACFCSDTADFSPKFHRDTQSRPRCLTTQNSSVLMSRNINCCYFHCASLAGGARKALD
ncbi:hypothetical protein P692DRAFT_20232049 [Suillus brevipes Sb2]|nr:hypothetical protein P692DRAFT_20232049 [Suillus brevipes Sb2]